MKSDTDNEHTEEKDKSKGKRPKKLVIPPKSKPKRSFIAKKLKLRSKSLQEKQEIKEISRIPLPNTSSDERQTPEGDENLMLTRSASDTNLQESWKSAEKVEESSKTDLQPERTKSLEDFQNMPAYGELIVDQNPLPSTSNANQSTGKLKDHLYKILVIGDVGTGKTSIIKRYVHRFFTQHYRATIGVDFALKVINWDENTLIRLQLWDIAGQERFGNMTRVYYKEAVGAFIVFDVTRKETFDSVVNWKADLDSKVQFPDGSKIPCVLLGNKCDRQKEGIVASPSKMEEYCREHDFNAWFETSAKDNINIDEAARCLVEKILACDSLLESDSKRPSDQFALTKDGNRPGTKNCACYRK
ncbi:unnamed protein product [Phyllotreta striolata]|uniref:Ras-related protein Rab n=1 Tax=Phyllotreta striolata TaxID=444603 RepID=A0A9N9XKD0_PHYSR|nr:unnamed protein product [Phyllotreta striolata]